MIPDEQSVFSRYKPNRIEPWTFLHTCIFSWAKGQKQSGDTRWSLWVALTHNEHCIHNITYNIYDSGLNILQIITLYKNKKISRESVYRINPGYCQYSTHNTALLMFLLCKGTYLFLKSHLHLCLFRNTFWNKFVWNPVIYKPQV